MKSLFSQPIIGTGDAAFRESRRLQFSLGQVLLGIAAVAAFSAAIHARVELPLLAVVVSGLLAGTWVLRPQRSIRTVLLVTVAVLATLTFVVLWFRIQNGSLSLFAVALPAIVSGRFARRATVFGLVFTALITFVGLRIMIYAAACKRGSNDGRQAMLAAISNGKADEFMGETAMWRWCVVRDGLSPDYGYYSGYHSAASSAWQDYHRSLSTTGS